MKSAFNKFLEFSEAFLDFCRFDARIGHSDVVVVFAFQGAADRVTISEAFRAAWPFVGLFIIGMVALAFFPPLVTYLPSLL